jgi:putative membrane protein insertion efficiency factor
MLQWLLSVYKRWVSPALPAACRFVPTCSEYAMEAVERHGAMRGGLLAAWRILRCQPLARAGYDPVPQDLQKCTRFGGENFASGHDLEVAETLRLRKDSRQGTALVVPKSGSWSR